MVLPAEVLGRGTGTRQLRARMPPLLQKPPPGQTRRHVVGCDMPRGRIVQSHILQMRNVKR